MCFSLLKTYIQPDRTTEHNTLHALTEVAEIRAFDLRPRMNSAHMLKVSRVGLKTVNNEYSQKYQLQLLLSSGLAVPS